jgi:hypothetical protein
VERLADGIDDASLVRADSGDRVVDSVLDAADVDGGVRGMAHLHETAGTAQLRKATERNHHTAPRRRLERPHGEGAASQRSGHPRREESREAACAPGEKATAMESGLRSTM